MAIKTQTIRCIRKQDRPSPYEAIEMVGGVNDDGSRWKMSQQWAVEGIDSGEWQFFVEIGKHRVKVVAETSRFGHRYIRTEADQDTPDNLLNLPDCP